MQSFLQTYDVRYASFSVADLNPPGPVLRTVADDEFRAFYHRRYGPMQWEAVYGRNVSLVVARNRAVLERCGVDVSESFVVELEDQTPVRPQAKQEGLGGSASRVPTAAEVRDTRQPRPTNRRATGSASSTASCSPRARWWRSSSRRTTGPVPTSRGQRLRARPPRLWLGSSASAARPRPRACPTRSQYSTPSAPCAPTRGSAGSASE